MKKLKKIIVGLCVCILIFGYTKYSRIFEWKTDKFINIVQDSNEFTRHLSSSLTSTDPINISSPSDWALYPFITGNGSVLNPYVIEYVEIHGTGVNIEGAGSNSHLNYSYNGIFINSGERFIIRNCLISDFSIGIQFSISANITQVTNVTIENCGLGIYNFFTHITVNISDCYISKCNWISTMGVFDLESHVKGGYGIWTRSYEEASIISNCLVEDCSVGIYISGTTNITQNELINCGFFLQRSMLVISLPYIHPDNNVNGKPFKLFWHEDNLVIRQSDADNYGQMIFLWCDNLQITRVSITEPCTVGLYIENFRINFAIGIESANGTELENVECRNQLIGMYLSGHVFDANKLTVDNCDVGFLLNTIRYSNFTKLSTPECEIPFFAVQQIRETTIQIVPETPFYFLDIALQSHGFRITSSSTFFDIGNETSYELQFQLNTTDLYHVTCLNPGVGPFIDFYLDIRNLVIPGFNLFILLGIMGISIVLFVRKYTRNKSP
ncbi:MAG: Loki-CTERM sorting domain-containing protein [Promethearchaeota archaeon]